MEAAAAGRAEARRRRRTGLGFAGVRWGVTRRRLPAGDTERANLSENDASRPDSRVRIGRLEPRIDRLAFQGEDAKHALVNPSERFSLDEPFEPFDPQRELAQSQRPLPRKSTFAEALEVLGQRVLGSIDDPEVLTAAALHRWLKQATEVVATNCSGLTTAPSPPVSVTFSHQAVAAPPLAGSASSTT